MNGRTLASEREGRLFGALKVCAAASRTCPTNGELCELLGMDSVGATSGVMSRLEKRGLIKVERGPTSRVVTIVETGQRTAGTIAKSHWSAKHGRPSRRARPEHSLSELPEPEPTVRVDRDPCTFCGVRGDVGCKHRLAA